MLGQAALACLAGAPAAAADWADLEIVAVPGGAEISAGMPAGTSAAEGAAFRLRLARPGDDTFRAPADRDAMFEARWESGLQLARLVAGV